MKDWLNKVWPWKAISELESRISRLNMELAQERNHHSNTKAENHALKGEIKIHQTRAAEREVHVRKMVQIIALKGGIIG